MVSVSRYTLLCLLRAASQLPDVLDSSYTLRERNALRQVRLLCKRLSRHM